MRLFHFGGALLFAVAGCGPTPKSETSNLNAEMVTDNLTVVPESPKPLPAYADHEDDRYLYTSAVSEEDKKKGKVLGDVIQYRYLGDNDGVLTLQHLSQAGASVGNISCRRDCRILNLTYGNSIERIPYDPQSVVGSAMQDAINGHLEPMKSPAAPEIQRHIPNRFIGVWQSNVAQCGTGLDDTALTVKPNTLNFYESGIEFANVTILSPDRIKVSGVLEDETGGRQRMTYTLRLTAGKLSVDDSIQRSRCP